MRQTFAFRRRRKGKEKNGKTFECIAFRNYLLLSIRIDFQRFWQYTTWTRQEISSKALGWSNGIRHGIPEHRALTGNFER